MNNNGPLKGKKFLITGVANDHSIAWAIAQELSSQGAELILTYPNEAIEKRVRPLAKEISCKNVLHCDVQSDEDLDRLFHDVGQLWGGMDGMLHSIAFADRKEMECRFHEITRYGFKQALDVSTYSLIAMCKRALPMLKKNHGSVLTLSYLGSQRVVPNYSIMGVAKAALEASVRYLSEDLGHEHVRVNAISAGPIKTLAASGIPQFRDLLAEFAKRAPLKRNVSLEDVAKAALFLLSQQGSGMTGEVMYVDCGYNVMGM